MHIESSTYITSGAVYTKRTEESAPHETGQNAAPSSKSPHAGAETYTTNPTSRLAADTLGFLLNANTTETTAETTAKDRLDIAFQHMVEDAASDPEFAQQQADFMGQYPELMLMNEPFPANGAPAEEWERFTAKTTTAMNLMLDAHQERQAHYEQLVSEGVTGVELYAQMLEFNAAQTTFNEKADTYSGKDTGTRTQHYQDMAAYLRGLMSEEV